MTDESFLHGTTLENLGHWYGTECSRNLKYGDGPNTSPMCCKAR